MKITLLQEEISNVNAEGLVRPVDGIGCDIGGGTKAYTALKASYSKESDSLEEQIELLGYIEKDIRLSKPIAHGHSRVFAGNETWKSLVVIAGFYHNLDDRIYTSQENADLLTQAIQSGVRESVKHNLQSIAMTLMGTSGRVTAKESIFALINGLAAVSRERIEVKWCIPHDEDFQYAKTLSSYLEGSIIR